MYFFVFHSLFDVYGNGVNSIVSFIYPVFVNIKSRLNLIAGRPKAAILFRLLLVVLFNILARFIVVSVVSVVSICLVCNFSIVATCPSIQLPALLFVCVVFVVCR